MTGDSRPGKYQPRELGPSVRGNGSLQEIRQEQLIQLGKRQGKAFLIDREGVQIGPGTIRVPADWLAGWKRAFPLVDVDAELVKVREYALMMPGWARRKRSWRRTIWNWLSREQERRNAGRLRGRGLSLADRKAEVLRNLRSGE